MKATGYISKTVAHKKYHELTCPDQKKYILFFEEIMEDRFFHGDVLEFDIGPRNELGETALKPIKKGNIYLEDLKKHLTTQEPFTGYVFMKRNDGYNVSYNGYRCFLPEDEIGNISIGHDQNLDLLHSFQQFVVIYIKDGNVIVSLKQLMQLLEQKRLAETEIKSLEKGFAFNGKVKNVKGFGVFILYQFSQGLLHISNIILDYDAQMDRTAKKAIEEKLATIFYEGRSVSVSIDNISDCRYSLRWDINEPINKEICTELAAIGVAVVSRSNANIG